MAGNGLGRTLDDVGDLDGDGVCDFIAGWRESHVGYATIYSGADRSVIYQHQGTQLDDNLGDSGSAGVGDINHDGYPDYCVSARNRDTQGLRDNGVVLLYSGRTGTLLYRFEGTLKDEMMGTSVSGGGDVNGDGFLDIVVGSVLSPLTGPPDAGRATVFAGNDLFLHPDNSTPTAGESLRLNIRGGASLGLGLLALIEANGVPVFVPILFGALDDTGLLSHQAVVPPGFAGQEFTLMAWAQKHPAPGEAPGQIADSAPTTIRIQ